MWNATFWKALAERAISTAAQSAILVIGADQFNVLTLNWENLLGFAAGGAALSVLKGLAANAASGTGPGVGTAEVVKGGPTA